MCVVPLVHVTSARPATSPAMDQCFVDLPRRRVGTDPDWGGALPTFTGDLSARFNSSGGEGTNLCVVSSAPDGAHLLERVPIVGTLASSRDAQAD